MYITVRPCEMVLVNKFHEAWFVSVTNVSLLDVPFFCILFNVARLSLCRVEASVQAIQLLGQLLPGHVLLLPRLGLPGLRQSFRGHVVRLGPLLYLRKTPEPIESSAGLQRSHQGRPQIRSFPGHPSFVENKRVRSCAPRRKFSSITRQLQKKARSPLHNLGSTLRSDDHWVCRVVSNDDHIVVRRCQRQKRSVSKVSVQLTPTEEVRFDEPFTQMYQGHRCSH